MVYLIVIEFISWKWAKCHMLLNVNFVFTSLSIPLLNLTHSRVILCNTNQALTTKCRSTNQQHVTHQSVNFFPHTSPNCSLPQIMFQHKNAHTNHHSITTMRFLVTLIKHHNDGTNGLSGKIPDLAGWNCAKSLVLINYWSNDQCLCAIDDLEIVFVPRQSWILN